MNAQALSSDSAAPPSGALRLEILRSAADLAALAGPWEELRGGIRPYLTHAWLMAWAGTFGRGAALEIRLVRQDGRLVGALPLCTAGPAGALVPMGWGRIGLAAWMIAPEAAAPEQILALLLRPPRLRCLLLEPLEASDAETACTALRAAGARCENRATIPAVTARLGGDFQAHLMAISKNARSAYRKSAKRLSGDGFRWITSDDSPADALEGYFAVAATSWKHGAGTGFAATPEGRDFMTRLVQTMPPGSLRLSALFEGGTPVACSFGQVAGGVLRCNAFEFNEAYASAGAGRLAAMHDIEWACAQGLEAADMMRSEHMTQSVTNSERMLHRLRIWRPGSPGIWALHAGALARRLRRRVTGWKKARAGALGATP